MGTNYYLESGPQGFCSKCNRPFENVRRHIGKSSAGWVFSLHVYPHEGINDLPDWWDLWTKQGAVIKNEYGEVVSADSMLACILGRFGKRDKPEESNWYRINQAEEGPYGLARAKVDGRRVMSHGLGTYSLCVGHEESW